MSLAFRLRRLERNRQADGSSSRLAHGKGTAQCVFHLWVSGFIFQSINLYLTHKRSSRLGFLKIFPFPFPLDPPLPFKSITHLRCDGRAVCTPRIIISIKQHRLEGGRRERRRVRRRRPALTSALRSASSSRAHTDASRRQATTGDVR